jgi:flagellar motor protein MotB
VAFIDRSTRVGRSQGASIFWGLVSVSFAAAACFYYFQNQKNEAVANQMRDTVLQLKEENESLNSEKDHLQSAQTEAESQLKTREDLVQQKETQLADEEVRLENLGQQATSNSPENLAQVTVVKRFNDVIRKIGKDSPPDVVERGGRPVLRIPNATLFAPGDATLKPEGKALLSQIAAALDDQLDTFELRVVSYTDSNAEADAAPAPATAPATAPDAKPHATSWDLTAARAAAIAHYYRDQTPVPFLNVLVIGRGDSEPIASNTGESHARNRRVEITITPLPVPFHAPDPDKDKTGAGSTAATPSATTGAKTATASSTDNPAPAKKAKDKKSSGTPTH